MADIGFSVALEGVATLQAQVDALRKQINESAGQAGKKLAGISDFFVQSLKQGSPIVGRAVEAYMNPMQGAIQLTADFIGSLGGFAAAADEAAGASAQLDARLKSTGGAAGLSKEALDELAESLAQITLFEDDAIRNSEALLLTFTDIKGDTFKRAEAGVLDLATAMANGNRSAIDLQGATLQLGKALNDTTGGGLGALSRAGVKFSADAEAMIKSLFALGKTAEAQALILTEVEKQVKGSAKAAAEAGMGPWLQFKKQLGELGETIGGFVVPVLNTLGTVLGPILPILIPLVGAFAAATVAVLAFNSAMFATVKTAIKSVVSSIGTAAGAMQGFAISVATALGPVGLLIAGATALGVALYALSGPPTTQTVFALGHMGESIEANAERYGILGGAVEKFGKGLKDWSAQEIQDRIAANKYWKDWETQVQTSLDNLHKRLQEFRDARIDIGAASLTELNTKLSETKKAYEDAAGSAKDAMIPQIFALEEQIKKEDSLTLAREALKKATEDQKKADENWIEAMKRGHGTIADLEFRIGEIARAISVTPPENQGVLYGLISQSVALKAQLEAIQNTIKELSKPAAFVVQDMPAMSTQMDVEIPGGDEISAMRSLTNEWIRQNEEISKNRELVLAQKEAFKQLGDAFADLAFNMGLSIALGQDLGVVMMQFISDLIAQVGKMVGMALITIAGNPLTPFPANVGFLAAGLAVLGLSGLLSGITRPKGDSASSTPDLTQTQSQQAQNAPGLSSFNQSAFTPNLIIDGAVFRVGDELIPVVLKEIRNREIRRGG